MTELQKLTRRIFPLRFSLMILQIDGLTSYWLLGKEKNKFLQILSRKLALKLLILYFIQYI